MSKFVFKHTLNFWEILTLLYIFAHNSKLILPHRASLAGVGSHIIVVSGILNATFSRNPHENWLVSSRDTSSWKVLQNSRKQTKIFTFNWLYLKIKFLWLSTHFAWSHHIYLPNNSLGLVYFYQGCQLSFQSRNSFSLLGISFPLKVQI